MKRIFITGIGTDIGKTIASAVITEALQADYWKPVQCGLKEQTDTERVKSLISNKKSVIHPEAFRLQLPASPHAAAAAEGVIISLKDIKAPPTSNTLVIEGAGGLMVPFNEKELVIDLIQQLNATAILVVKHYLGSINHTLMSLEALQHRNIPCSIIFNGAANKESERAILAFFKCPVIGRIGEEKDFTPEVILRYANEFNASGAIK